MTIPEIQSGLDKEFLPLEPMLSGYRIKRKILDAKAIAETETILETQFPIEFRALISVFDFGMLTIGPIAFCAGSDYLDELIKLNTSVCWWGCELRPSDLIMIANSDPFTILLNIRTGHVLAMDPETVPKDSKTVAKNFHDFFCGIGSAILMRNAAVDRKNLAKAICDCVQGESLEFWSVLTH